MAESTRSLLTAADVMTTHPRTCSAFSSVLEASLLFQDADCGAVPVVDGGRPVGILTDRDVALAVANNPDLGNRPVADFMSKDVISVAPDASLEEVGGALRPGRPPSPPRGRCRRPAPGHHRLVGPRPARVGGEPGPSGE